MVDDETSAATNEQGDAGAAPRTNLGISMYMNTHNVVMRRAVKCWDDDITIPFIGRLYDWNMQYNENEEVKGDCRIDARGSSSLLVREMQAQNLMQLAKLALTPALASMTKIPELYRKIVQSMHIEADEIVLTNDEIERIQQQQSEQPQQMPPELQMQMQKLQMEQQENQRKYELDAKRLDVEIQKTQTEAENNALDARTTAAQIQRDVERMTLERETSLRSEQLELAKMANARQMTIDALQAQVGMKKLDIDSKHQLFNAEAAIKASQGSGI